MEWQTITHDYNNYSVNNAKVGCFDLIVSN